MRKIGIVSLISFIFLSFCSITEYLLRNITFNDYFIPLLIGFGILIISGIVSAIIKEDLYFNIVCFLFNAIALGFCLRSWYMYRGFDNALWVQILISFACVMYLLVFYFLLYIPFFDKHFKIYIWSFLVLTLIAYILIIIFSKTTFMSTFGYFVIIEIAFIFAMCKREENFTDLFRNITLSSFSVLIVAIIILLIMLECDGLDGFDFGTDILDITSPKNKKKKV